MTDYAARKLTEMFVEAEMGQPLPWLMRSRRRCVRCVHRIIAGHSERTQRERAMVQALAWSASP
ncbi:hypothetical protein [Xanthomonas phaseoli]|uniref:hypothetical protein n=1 Tax=Xanthomonas phaseoli TaxID=1985254 RepID=UPI00178C18BC|nr:hypothetical protein [Xanthomonas phaseoli]